MPAPTCDAPQCGEPAKVFIGVKLAHGFSAGYMACEEHQADGFWQVMKRALQGGVFGDVHIVDVADIEEVWTSQR